MIRDPIFKKRLATVSSVALIVLLVGALIGVAALLSKNVLLLAFFAVLIATVLNYPIRLFSRIMPRGAALLLSLLLLIGLGGGVGYLAAAKVADQARNVSAQIPHARHQAEQWMRKLMRSSGAPEASPTSAANPANMTGKAVRSAIELSVPAALGVVEGLSALILTIALAAFLVHRPDAFRRGFRVLLPSGARPDFDALWPRVSRGLKHWLGGAIISMTIMGSLTALGLWLAGIDAWLFLGLLTFLGTFVPYAGAIASAIPGLLFALAQSPGSFLHALLVYLGVHIVEGYIVAPLIMKRAVEINPALLLIWQAVMAATLGILGIVVATPLLVCVQISVVYWRIERAARGADTTPFRPTRAAS